MTLAITGFSHGLGDTIALPTHNTGDCIVVIAVRHASITPPTLPNSWINLTSAGVATSSVCAGMIHATSSSMTSGTWTNASFLIALVLSDPGYFVTVEPISINAAASATNIPYNTDPVVGTFPTGIADTGVFAFHYNQNLTNNLTIAPGTMTNQLTGGNGTSFQYALHAQFPRVTAWPTTATAMSLAAAYRTGTFIAKSYVQQNNVSSAIIDPLSYSMIG